MQPRLGKDLQGTRDALGGDYDLRTSHAFQTCSHGYDSSFVVNIAYVTLRVAVRAMCLTHTRAGHG
eukprot:12195-Eustigmatos_ZCMA.PRE.1